MDYGYKVSRDGYDVLTANDEQLAFTSKYYLQKIYSQGSITLTVPATSSGTTTVAHNLGYRPSFLAWVRNIYATNTPTTLAGESNSDVYVDTTNLSFKGVNSFGGSRDFVFYYYIFIDDGQ